jgi:alkanesulfonate monooxygenase SsuD/methylene tetrahydromethanopterin reductase-like flavin-dependent oxidoreductase (luciferase family)
MSAPSVGVCLPIDRPDARAIQGLASRIEELGFDHLAVGEHVLAGRPTPAVFTTLAFVAATTGSIGLVTAVALAPLYPAALLAKLAASLDALSGGRLVLGVGVGGEVPAEFEACGVPLRERGIRTTDALRVVQALTASSGPVSMATSRWRLAEAALQPPPVRAIPCWVAGRSEAATARAAELGDAWFPYFVTPEQVAAGSARLRCHAREFSRPTPETVVYCYVNVGPDRGLASASALSFVSKRYSVPTERLRRYVVAGDPERCVSRLREYLDAGVSGFMLRLACEEAASARMIGMLAKEVVPGLREGSGAERAANTARSPGKSVGGRDFVEPALTCQPAKLQDWVP